MESLLHTALTAFASNILHTPLYGKEREAVGHYAFNFLSKGQRKGQAVANEATVKISVDVRGAWEAVERENGLNFLQR